MGNRKGWLAHAVLPQGTLLVDEGAANALINRGASLLAVGIRAVEGRFGRHQRAGAGRGWPRDRKGLVALGSEELEAILGLDRAAIARTFGTAGDTVIHRDHFVLTPAVAHPGQT